MDFIKKVVQNCVKELFDIDIEPTLTRPNEKFGDYATNVALQLATKLQKSSNDIARQLADALEHPDIIKVNVAGPGFINITLSDKALINALNNKPTQSYANKTVVIEHTDANPFKEFHIGHAYSNTVGESLGRLYKAAGANVHQVSYHGDVGLHIAKAVYGMKVMQLERLHDNQKALAQLPEAEQFEFIKFSYALGVKSYDSSDDIKKEIEDINLKIYQRNDKYINEIYDMGRQWSFEYFESIYKRLNVSFEKQYFESDTGVLGKKIVEQHITDGIFEKSDGAVIFKGERFDLHTRVFINSQGLPTYEAKELGLAFIKESDYNFDEAVVVTANEIDQYFQVLLASLNLIDHNLAKKIKHISHGVVKLPSGKMSSRTGQVITAISILDLLEEAVRKFSGQKAIALEENVQGALKYTFLKHRIGGDIVFDIQESINLEGNSGPYLQYAYARACSILAKKPTFASDKTIYAQDNLFWEQTISRGSSIVKSDIVEPNERSLLRKITEFPEVVDKAVQELMPHVICTYLYELAQVFNRFYESNRVIDDPREAIRLYIIKTYADTLKDGLDLLNIPAPEKM